jgi:hypothetical protein
MRREALRDQTAARSIDKEIELVLQVPPGVHVLARLI